MTCGLNEIIIQIEQLCRWVSADSINPLKLNFTELRVSEYSYLMILQILAVGLLVAIVYFGVVPWIKCKRIQKGIKSPSRMVFFPLGGYIASSVVRHGKEDDLLNWLPKGKQSQERFLVTNLFASPYIIL